MKARDRKELSVCTAVVHLRSEKENSLSEKICQAAMQEAFSSIPNERKGRSQTDVGNSAISTISIVESIVEKYTLSPQLLKWSEL